MNEYRVLTAAEWTEFSPIFQKIGYYSPDSIARFVDTRLDKIYDVFLLGGNLVLKKTDRDKEKYDSYFSGHDFAVPPILSSFQFNNDCWVSMPYIKGTDARYCTPEDSGRIGNELAKIQSYYLGTDTNAEGCRSYFDRKVLRFWNQIRSFFPAYNDVFPFIEARFFTAPRSLIHDDFLPINVLLDESKVWLIDWTYAEILPYFLDLARFAYIRDEKGELFISDEATTAFLDSYYKEMRKNSLFKIEKREFLCDVALAAFCQYSMFVFYEDAEKVMESADYHALKEILGYLDHTLKSTYA